MEEKKSSGVVVVIALLCLLIGGAGGYFVCANYMNKSDTTSKNASTDKSTTINGNKTNDNVTVYSIADPKVANLIDNLTYSTVDYSCDQNTIWYYAKDKAVKASDIDSNRAFDMVKEYNDLNNDGKVTLDEIERAIQNILGKDYKFDSTKDIVVCSHVGYDSKTKSLLPPVYDTCGGACDPQVALPSYKLVKAVETNGILEINVKVVFEDGNKIYSDYAKKNVIATYNSETDEYLDSNKKTMKLDDVLNKGSDYKFTFKLEDGNYIFVSAEPLK